MIYVPIILDPFSFDDDRFVWEYLKYIYHCYENKWPIIAQERYRNCFFESEQWKSKHYFTKDFMTRHQFQALDKCELDEMDSFYIPNKIIDDLIKQKGSRLEAKLFLLNNRYEPLEEVLTKYVLKIVDEYGKIGAFIGWAAHYESVKYIGEKYKIKCFTQEYSLRHVNYRSCCYLCDGDIYDSESCISKLNEFEDGIQQLDFNILEREEILAFFLTKRTASIYKKYLNNDEESNRYEIGMAGVHPFITTFLAKSMYTDLELALDIRLNYDEKDILFRMHPGDEPFHADYGFKNIDTSLTAAEFICRCKKIAAIGSNIVPEALLWGKPVFTNKISPFFNMCQKELSVEEKWFYPTKEMLNYIFFVYLVPFELICNEEYLTWRLGEPSAIEIYNRHINFYLEQEKIPLAVLACRKSVRFSEIMIARGLGEYIR